MPQAADVNLTVFDVSGRLVNVLLRGPMPQGRHSIRWSGETASGGKAGSGVYYYVLRAGSYNQIRKMVLAK